ncbi:histone-lysine N-methyltransferase SETMAR-like, partial [Stegodyphus dumicola]|uniref:histone-lysine N-methyltransferase SETMAR-like n=1 Tax=Stegodyphus dumicola TaxID=202533 RepID=UPI0015ABF353
IILLNDYVSFQYTPTCILTSGTLAKDYESIPFPCKCKCQCQPLTCSCIVDSNIFYANGLLPEYCLETTTKPIIECSSLCACNQSCPNRIIQQGIKFSLQVFMTKSKGFGVRTLEFIPKLSYVCEYAGEIIDSSEMKHRMNNRFCDESNYIYVLKEHTSESRLCTIIDPTEVGNVGRYLNHSCNPNLVSVPIRANSMIPRICFFAKGDILPLQELTYNYSGEFDEKESSFSSTKVNASTDARQRCYCCSPSCTGFLPYDNNWLS